MIEELYPKSPQIDDYSFLEPSSNFKKSVYLVVFSIFIFFIFYLLLLAFSIALLVTCVYAGINLITIHPSFYTLIIGLGLLILGIMFILFLIKFIFSGNKDENPFRNEIKEKDHPMLFQFIKNISDDIKTRFPKKIFLTPDVNAAVFYNSGFWSMIFPVSKNLEIGLGLVNSLNISEFKAVIAHEFGHFSQKSLKLGSYIYTVNRAIYNMVYEYDNWDNLLSAWAAAGGLFGFFARITFWLVEGVRSLLKIAYNFININYLKLSREMEFNADLISASVAGSKQSASALRKIEFASSAYEHTMEILHTFMENGKSSSNVYKNHSYIISHFSKEFGLKMVDGMPVIRDSDIERHLVKSRINIKNQWASHPSLIERDNNLNKLAVNSEINSMPTWKIFSHIDKLQQETSKILYKIGFPGKKLIEIKEGYFKNYVQDEEDKFKISSKYDGFYQDRFIQEFDVDELINSDSGSPEFMFDQVYSKAKFKTIKKYIDSKNDMEILSQIAEGKIKTKYFEYDSEKFRKKDAMKLKEGLAKEIVFQENILLDLDQKSFLFNYRLAKQSEMESVYVKKFKNLILSQKSIKEIGKFVSVFQDLSYKLYSKSRWTNRQISLLANEVSEFEQKFKNYLKSVNFGKFNIGSLNYKEKKLLKDYKSSKSYYINKNHFDEQKFMKLSELVYTASSNFGMINRKLLKDLTEFQLELYQLKKGQ